MLRCAMLPLGHLLPCFIQHFLQFFFSQCCRGNELAKGAAKRIVKLHKVKKGKYINLYVNVLARSDREYSCTQIILYLLWNIFLGRRFGCSVWVIIIKIKFPNQRFKPAIFSIINSILEHTLPQQNLFCHQPTKHIQ